MYGEVPTTMKMSIRLILPIAGLLAGFLTTGAADEETSVQTIVNGIQNALARVQTDTGVTAEQLHQLAEAIAQDAQSFLDNKGAQVEESEVRTLLTDASGDLHNFAGLTALFDDALSLEAAKLDSAFYLLRQLSADISNDDTDSHDVDVAVAAVGKLSLAIADTASETKDIATYLYNNSDDNANDGDDEDDEDDDDDDDDIDGIQNNDLHQLSRRGWLRKKWRKAKAKVKAVLKGVARAAVAGVVISAIGKRDFQEVQKRAKIDEIADKLISEIHSDTTVDACTGKCVAICAKFNLRMVALACKPICNDVLKILEDRVG